VADAEVVELDSNCASRNDECGEDERLSLLLHNRSMR
jgi:hypothetical protein